MRSAIKKAYYKIFNVLLGKYRTKVLPLNELEKNLLNLKTEGYLFDEGWILSFERKEVMDREGRPKPWLTYSATAFLAGRLNESLDLFEYGGGNSTFFWATRCRGVTTVEHDQDWYKKVAENKPVNADIHFQALEYGGDYCRFPNSLDKKFDVIIVDGRDRVNCCKSAVNSLTDKGVIVLDDALRESYKEAYSYLSAIGFRWIDFWGMEAFYLHRTCTTVFYKNNNCLGI